jgi:lysophospholipase L1-like esterase
LLVLVALAWGLMPETALPGPVLRVRETLRCDQMNEADYERMERGYYEHLLDAGRQLGAPAGPAPGRALQHTVAIVPFDAGPLTITVDDLREYVLKPNLSVVRGRGVTWSTNSLGMRDRSYSKAKSPHTFRIALVGDSIGSGWGVNDDEGFEPVLERTLDARSRAAGGPVVEILNFAVPGYAPGQRWENFCRSGWELETDLVLYEATLADPGWDERRLRGLLPRGIGWDAPMYREALVRAGARAGGDMEAYKEALRRSRWDILAGVYRTIATECQARGVPSVWILIPRVGKATDPIARDRLMALAQRSGFSAVVDLSDAFDGIPAEDLAIDPSDYHPNASGHTRLAQKLDDVLTARPEVRQLWAGSAAGAYPR